MAETVDAKNTNSESEVLQPVSFDEFDVPSYDQWKAEAEKALKGGIFDKKMFTKTYEGITLDPIYTPKQHQATIKTSVFPGASAFTRGTKASGYIQETWGVSQYVDDTMPKNANHSSLYEIVKGSSIHNIKYECP